MPVSSQADFHNAVHGSVGIPSPKTITIVRQKRRIRRNINKVHKAVWADAVVNLKTKTITINVYINFQKNVLSNVDYIRLKNLAIRGINRYWSRRITLSGDRFQIFVRAHHRPINSLDVDLYISTDKNYARSHNSGLIDASFKYNQGFYGGNNAAADNDFILVSAHEFGHSVLKYFGDSDLSWTHKGSTGKYNQKVQSTTPGYPSKGEIDLMKYYDGKKSNVTSSQLYSRSTADEIDVKRLIWLCNIRF